MIHIAGTGRVRMIVDNPTSKTKQTKKGANLKMPLSPQAETFCCLVASGVSQQKAYRQAFDNTDGVKDSTIQSRITQLAKSEPVKARLAELRDELTKKTLKEAEREVKQEKEKILALIWKRIGVCEERNDDSAIARYTDQLNRIHGLYREVPVKDEPESKLGSLNIDELKAIVNISLQEAENTEK